METSEYSNLAHVERTHWYYRGKRAFVRFWLESTLPPGAGRKRTLLDCGAGTGYFAKEMSDTWEVHVQDADDNAIQFLRQEFPPHCVSQSTTDALPYRDGQFDAVTALDVLEHIPRHREAAAELARVLRPGGVAVVTVPAMMALWSDWDVALHHCRRYSADELHALFPAAEWTINHLNYTNVLPMPLIWIIRKLRRKRAAGHGRAEDRLPPSWINHLLFWQMVTLAQQRCLRFPFGVSLLLVATRKASQE